MITSFQFRRRHSTIWERCECKYAEATVLSQVLEANLTLNGEKLLCEGVAGRLWREHSPRAFLTSCTGCLEYQSNWQDAIGGWSTGQSQAYVRTTRYRIGAMQKRVARMLRAGRGNSLGERKLEEDLGNHLLKIGCDVGLVREQVDRLRKARVFAAKCSQEGFGSRKRKSRWMRAKKKMVEWRESEENKVQVESFGTVTPRAEEHKTTETEVVESGVFPTDLTDFSHLAKKGKVQNERASQKILVAQLVLESSGIGKLESAQLVPESAGNQNLQSAQLGTGAQSTEEATQAMPVKELTIQREEAAPSSRHCGDQTKVKETGQDRARDPSGIAWLPRGVCTQAQMSSLCRSITGATRKGYQELAVLWSKTARRARL